MDPAEQAQLEKLIQREQQRSGSGGTAASLLGQQQLRHMTGSPATMADAPETNESTVDYQLDGHYLPDNIDISSTTAHGG